MSGIKFDTERVDAEGMTVEDVAAVLQSISEALSMICAELAMISKTLDPSVKEKAALRARKLREKDP